MRNKLLTLAIAASCLMFTTAFANVVYSPYVDLTLDTHWNNNKNSPEPLDLIAISAQHGIQSFHLAFINDAGNCTPAWGGMSNISVKATWGKSLTDKMTAKKIKYVISFGGSNGNDMSQSCSQDQLTAVYEQVIATYHPQGLDFDIENGTANISKLITSLQKIQAHHPDILLSLTLPVMPSGLLAPQKAMVEQAHAADLNFSVNIMAMDYANTATNMGSAAVQALQSTFLYLHALYPQKSADAVWQMLQVTPQIGVNDFKNELFKLSDADTVKDFAEEQAIGGIAMWSLNRDKPCANTNNNMHCSGDNLQTTAYEFSQHFLNN